MTTIDHRILIPAAPDVVWDYVSDITHNPDWQVDCTDVIFLTSRREGPGLRWRYATPGGHEMVIAVTAWYNGLGYEYYFVDGTPFRENKGRIRLQEIPEGTIVQWTFTYELGGLLGGMRNSMGMRRQVDQTISESLKTLWQKIKQSGASQRTLEPKSLMRDAPDVEARSAYQPRHPSIIDQAEADKPVRLAPTRLKVEPPITDDDAQRISVISEPPIREDDTRPRSPYQPPAAAQAAPVSDFDADFEPDFLDDLVEPEHSPFERQIEHEHQPDAIPVPAAEPDFVVESDLSRFEPPRDPTDTQPRHPDSIATPQESPAELTESLVDLRHIGEETEPLPAPRQPEIAPESTPPALEQVTAPVPELGEETQLEIDADATVRVDEAQTQPGTPPHGASIWEIFGVPRPSETQELRQLETNSDAPAAASEPEAVEQITTVAPSEPEPVAADPVVAVAAPDALPAIKPSPLTVELPALPARIGLRIVLRRKLVRLRRP